MLIAGKLRPQHDRANIRRHNILCESALALRYSASYSIDSGGLVICVRHSTCFISTRRNWRRLR